MQRPDSLSQRPDSLSQRLNCRAADAHGPYSDKVYLPASFLSSLLAKFSLEELPSPITVRIAGKGTAVYCGVREFSSEEGYVGIPTGLLEQVAPTAENKDGGVVSVEFVQLEKGKLAELRVLDVEEVGNMRALFETHMRNNLTVLFVGETVRFPVGGRRKPLSFEVVSLEPDSAAVDIIQTDLTLKIIGGGNQSIGKSDASGGVLVVDDDGAQPLAIEVASGATHVLTLHVPAETTAVDVVLECSPGNDASLVASQIVHDVSEIDNDWNDYSAPSQMRKELHIERTNQQQQQQQKLPDGAFNIYVGVIADRASSTGFRGTISATSSRNEQPTGAEKSTPEDSTRICPNCKTDVPKGNYDMHTLFCERHNYRCDGCGSVLKRNSDEAKSHWHCDLCHAPGVLGDETKHARLFHTPCTCTCEGDEREYGSISELAEHRRSDCADRLIECRFCKIAMPQGPETASHEARMLGLRSHEWNCGNRAIACARCSSYVRIQHVAAHMRIHEHDDREKRANMIHCANKMCDRERAKGNPLGLCAMCYGPLYSNAWDPGHQKLLARLTRLLFTQMTQGCGNPECKNRGMYCTTGLTQSEAAAKIVPIVRAYAPLASDAERSRIDYDNIDLRLCSK
ncbi:hypothetical protein LPJ59_004044 [Coemansia sp. RSA 2399]|nr:hypothetical protein LPJ59_004044 [Coemansia sp. RSA 2399]